MQLNMQSTQNTCVISTPIKQVELTQSIQPAQLAQPAFIAHYKPEMSFKYNYVTYHDNGLLTSIYIGLLNNDIINITFDDFIAKCDFNYLRSIITSFNPNVEQMLTNLATILKATFEFRSENNNWQSFYSCGEEKKVIITKFNDKYSACIRNFNFTPMLEINSNTLFNIAVCVQLHSITKVIRMNNTDGTQDLNKCVDENGKSIYLQYIKELKTLEASHALCLRKHENARNNLIKKFNKQFIEQSQRHNWTINEWISDAIISADPIIIDLIIQNNVKLSRDQLNLITNKLQLSINLSPTLREEMLSDLNKLVF